MSHFSIKLLFIFFICFVVNFCGDSLSFNMARSINFRQQSYCLNMSDDIIDLKNKISLLLSSSSSLEDLLNRYYTHYYKSADKKLAEDIVFTTISDIKVTAEINLNYHLNELKKECEANTPNDGNIKRQKIALNNILIGFNERFDLMYSNIDLIKGSFKDTFKNEYKLKIIDNVKSINKFK